MNKLKDIKEADTRLLRTGEEKVCHDCGMVIVVGYKCDCGYLWVDDDFREVMIRRYKERCQDRNPNFIEICKHGNFSNIFQSWEA